MLSFFVSLTAPIAPVADENDNGVDDDEEEEEGDILATVVTYIHGLTASAEPCSRVLSLHPHRNPVIQMRKWQLEEFKWLLRSLYWVA